MIKSEDSSTYDINYEMLNFKDRKVSCATFSIKKLIKLIHQKRSSLIFVLFEFYNVMIPGFEVYEYINLCHQ